MTLTLIEKYPVPDGQLMPRIKMKGELSEQEKDLLITFFIRDDLMNREDQKALHTLCLSIHERDLWIQCDCLDASIKPVFRINRASSGNLYLHRITSRAEHAHHCLFKEQNYENNDRESNEPKRRLKKDLPFNLLGKKSQGLIHSTEGNAAQSRERGTGQTQLASALFSLLDAAELNVLSPEHRLKPLERLMNAAKSLELIKGLPLLHYLELNPNRLNDRAKALKVDSAQWPKGSERHCLFLWRVQSFTDQALEVISPKKTTRVIEVATRIYQSSGRFSDRTAPYMALVLMGTTAAAPWFYQPVKAFVMPTYSERSYFPVDSFYEREVMRLLYRLYFEALKKGTPFQLIKPLFGINLSANKDEKPVVVLPVFLIKKGNKTLVIEVNGSIEPAYLERKARTHEHMKRLGSLLSINGYQAELENRLKVAMARLMAEITHWLHEG